MKYSELGNKIKQCRTNKGWDQSMLASNMSATQQTISRWEKGASRPRLDDLLKLADILSGDQDDWLKLAGYDPVKPVRPLANFLPLAQLSPEKFELFSRDFIQKLHNGWSVHRYGKEGSTQNGIDLFAKKGSRKLDYQCKRHQQFGPADVDQAVKDTSMKADAHHILLTRPATTGARDAIDKYSDWSLWDVEDISAKVRSLDQKDALNLVDTYFPGWRKDFLGVDEPSPWWHADMYHRPLSNKRSIFSHAWSFFGRDQELESITNFISDNSTSVLLVVGRGGIGKSRLLKQITEIKSVKDPLFLAPGVQVNPSDYESLPKEGVLVIDDAHERDDIGSILVSIAALKPMLKVVVGVRPYGATLVRDSILKSGLIYNREQDIELGDMKVKHAEELSSEILAENDGDTDLAKRIAEITQDCPLATVVGSRLVADKLIKPDILNNSEQFRDYLLKSFRDIVAGDVGGPKNSENIKDLMSLIATVQPMNVDDPIFKDATDNILDRRYDKVIRDIALLENAGVVVQRKDKIRIAPDLLADYIRAEASYDNKSKLATGYIDLVFNNVKNELATNLITNISQLDWRLVVDGVQAELLKSIWSNLKEQFLNGTIQNRVAILNAFEKVAYYQPEQMIEFAELAVDNPTEESSKSDDDYWFTEPSYDDVIKKISPLLKYAAYNGEYTIKAIKLLKKLAENDSRSPDQYPDHPVRALKEIIAIEPRKPVSYIKMVADEVLTWDNVISENFSKLDILDEVLATEGNQSEMSGIKLTLTPFKVNIDAVKDIRDRVIDEAFKQANGNDSPVAVRAVKTIEESLRGRMGSSSDNSDLLKNQIEILGRLKKLVMTHPSPVVCTEARRAVSWHAKLSKTDTNKAANEVLSAIPSSQDYEFTRALMDSWGWSFERPDGNYSREESEFNQWKKKLTASLVESHKTDLSSLVSKLEEKLVKINESYFENSDEAGRFIFELCHASRDFTLLAAEYILSHPDSLLARYTSPVLNAIAKIDYKEFQNLMKQFIAVDKPEVHRRLSHAVGWGTNDLPVQKEDLSIIKKLSVVEDAYARSALVRVVRRFSDGEKHKALDILLGIPFADDKNLAGEVLGEFDEKHGTFKIQDLSEAGLQKIIKELKELDSLDKYEIGLFIGQLSLAYPQQTLELLFYRVENKQKHKLRDYHPVPFFSDRRPGLRVNETKEYVDSLRMIRDWMSEDTESWFRLHYGPDIFKAASAGYDETTLSVIREWMNTPNRQQLEVAANLLSEVPASFIWANSDLVIEFLEKAERQGEDCYKKVSSSLHSAVYQGSRTGTPGHPFQEDIDQRDESQKMLDRLPLSSPAYKFYKSLNEIAISNIKRDTYDPEDRFKD